jgi:subtilisin family serine protease
MRLLAPAPAAAFAVLLVAAPAAAQVAPPELALLVRPVQGRHPMAASDGRIPLSALIAPGQDARALGLVPVAPGLASVRLFPGEIEPFRAAHPGLRLGFMPPLRPTLDVATARSTAPPFRAATGLDGKGVVVGVVDTGFDVTHPDLRDEAGRTRVAWLIDLSRPPQGKHAALEHAYGCDDPNGGCAILDAADIDAAIASTAAGAVPRDTVGHGTHVGSIAAGNGLGSKGRAYAGFAPGATLVGARVTRSGGEDVSDMDVVTATRFVMERAEAATPAPMPVVVNVSLGADFGPHDGTTPLEKGLASLVGPDKPGRAIVVAAGNSGTLYVSDRESLGVHAEARVVPGAGARVVLRSPDLARSEVRGSVYVWIGWPEGDSISVGLEGHDAATWLEPVAPGSSAGWDTADESLTAGIINELVQEGSPLTPDTHGAVLMFAGRWPSSAQHTIVLEGSGTADLWVQGTDDAAPSSDGIGVLFANAIKQGTVNIPATHPDIIAVGATLNRTSWTTASGTKVGLVGFGSQRPPVDDSMAYFSGAGPTATGVPKPEISAPGAFVIGAMSRDARPSASPFGMFAAPAGICPSGEKECFVADASHAVAIGTSMAAPAVAGAIALLFSLEPRLTQPEVVALLQAGARWPGGLVPYGFQMGPGALDVDGARAAFEAIGRPIDREPDPAASWVVMSAAYARPDPRGRVWGTVETRAADRTIADGFDARQLELWVDGGVVASGLARVAPGLWRFALAARAGSGGGTLVAEVRYGGKVLGKRQALPIGVDYFTARDLVEARGGGCAVAQWRRHGPGSDGAGRGGAATLWAAVAAATLARKRRVRVLAGHRAAATGKMRPRCRPGLEAADDVPRAGLGASGS